MPQGKIRLCGKNLATEIFLKKIITLKQLHLKRHPLQVAAQTYVLISLPPRNPIKGQREGT